MEKLDEEIGDIKMHIIDLETTITLRSDSSFAKIISRLNTE